MKTILQGVVGSTAYGLAREGSDVDRLGVYMLPTRNIVDLGEKSMTHVSTNPDKTMHELHKYLSLGLKCNPSILELLWLDKYEVLTGWGRQLIELREGFLYESGVRNSYGGYAVQQIYRLKQRNLEGKDGFSSDVKQRTAKHARHCFRLLKQGRELLETGDLTVKVPNPEFYWQFDDASVDEICALFEPELERFNNATSVLPQTPDRAIISTYLVDLRKMNW